MANTDSAHKLVDEIAPKLGNRSSGYLRIKPTKTRRGDNTQMAKVSFVDDLQAAKVATPSPAKEETTKKAVKKPVKAATKTLAKAKTTKKESK